ncbi:MAG TPA: glycosyltransferase [Candidatus Baltobacteraceae bacterium]|nr:glycosyltransferase [Candidatus Baltobacteraceae bacterium]
MRRAWTIFAAHGPLVFARRGYAWLSAGARARLDGWRRHTALRAMWKLPSRPVGVAMPAAPGEPLVSIVVPAFDRWQYTNACLRALARVWDLDVPAEVIVVDDASTDATAELLAACSGIRVVRNERNGGFVAAVNAGAAAARGAYVHFLNNDTIVAPGWLRPLVARLASDERIAAAVSQLRYPDDTLAEAGGIIWSDGRGSNYGRGDSPHDWRYETARDVDYGSAASLLVRADAFRRAGGFANEFAPAYYEDADLCFALRAAAGRVAYEPQSVVYHAEGASYGSNVRTDARALQERHRERFARKWSDALRHHFAPDPTNADRAARRLCGSKTILVADEHVPFTDRDAGSRRIAALVELMRVQDWHVMFASLDRNEYPPYTAALREAGVDVLLGFDVRAIAELSRDGFAIDAAWLCRPGRAARLAQPLRDRFGAKIVFDTVDLHYLRLQREEQLLGRATPWQQMQTQELAIARAADVTVTTSAVERDLLLAQGVANAATIGIVESVPATTAPSWEQRGGIVFLGNYAHAPNVDAVRWLCAEVMPLVWQRLPDVRVTLAGADPTRAVRALASARVDVRGYVPDAKALLNGARVFAAPLRFGAGMKGKIVYALAHGIPVVTTPVGAEGIFTAQDYPAIASTAEEFAAQIVRLHQDRTVWGTLTAQGFTIAQRFTPESIAPLLKAALTLSP